MNLELLTNAILAHWKRIDFDEKEIVLNPMYMLKGTSERGFEYHY